LRNASIETIIAAVLGRSRGSSRGGNAGAPAVTRRGRRRRAALLIEVTAKCRESAADHAGVSFLGARGSFLARIAQFSWDVIWRRGFAGRQSGFRICAANPLTQDRIDYIRNFVEHTSKYSNETATS
jgi:hypothetical protein